MKPQLTVLSMALLSLTLFSCEKDKDTVKEIPDGYFVKANVAGEQKEFLGGVNGAQTAMDNSVDEFNGIKGISYYCVISPGGHNAYFEFSYGEVQIPDGNDRDQLDEIFKEGTHQVWDSGDSTFNVVYYGPDKYVYRRRHTDAPVAFTVSNVSAPFPKFSRTVVSVIGTIDSMRLFEFDRNLQRYTSNYKDVKNLTFKIPFQSGTKQ